jgi:deoxyribodipyrimidine photo-lyase
MDRDYPNPVVEHIQAAKSARGKISVIRREEGFRDQAKKIHQRLGSRKQPFKKRKITNPETSQLLLGI